MDYEIIPTLGPASATPALWREMIAAGATAFRLNSSHLSRAQVVAWLERLRGFYDQTGAIYPVVVDLQGSKWRLGQFPACEVEAGARLTLVPALSSDRAGVLPVPVADLNNLDFTDEARLYNLGQFNLRLDNDTPCGV